ncbi:MULTISPECIES: helix-turn-helix domain-containing protein [Acinetobacter]|jgi:putative transcriptional regulator|uniref:HTH cro/C1-type domain-containing protein n=1 Tax=Acinetobacter brisouii CIP 110357 TaxID=1341683 RepID=V2UV57_9GAMM|nr:MULTISPECIES: helix-turn-helix domain-containing protein [Acinetobacter]ENU79903.1 hypothetical protein F975_02239 [Acinetobacter sp. ANC 3789]ENV46513.1 hypothetical protein F954_02493 [Acinetobacter brisouii ANC 4119]ESK52501.1 hypothetical protein P255_00653 [Acinetobacter brisouii CIP 110357]KJV38441.1 hypothetical protein VH98_09400 [Acinetobacter brisouii]TCB86604.1 helix-turn-helix domain-containing protein [Acinetobacter sp. ANC 3791]
MDIKNQSIHQTQDLRLAQQIVLARKRIQITQLQLAQILGVSVRTLESWERGTRKPSSAAQTLLKLFIHNPSFVVRYLTY